MTSQPEWGACDHVELVTHLAATCCSLLGLFSDKTYAGFYKKCPHPSFLLINTLDFLPLSCALVTDPMLSKYAVYRI